MSGSFAAGELRSGATPTPVVLVVDDEPAILEVVQDVLEDEGYTVLPAREGREALSMALQTPPDLVLTDLMMPVMDGRTLFRRLRDDGRTAHIPVVLMSAAYQAQPGDAFVAVIAKPFSLVSLLDTVEQLLT